MSNAILAKRIIVIFFGIVCADNFVTAGWSPLLIEPPATGGNYRDISDYEKRNFFNTLFQTFQYNNPRAEFLDLVTSSYPSKEDLTAHYQDFDLVVKKIRRYGCPEITITVPTHWVENREAEDRVFNVFDVERCTETKGN